MDELDIQILQMLSKGVEINEIAKSMNVSRQSVYYRIQKLKKEVGLKETVSANLEKLGINTVVLVMVKWRLEESEGRKKFMPSLFENPHVILAFPVLGGWDYGLIVAARTMTEYSDFVSWVYKEGGRFLERWESLPITRFWKGGFELPDIQGLLGKHPD